MQPGDDLNEFPEGVEAALILLVRLMLVLILVHKGILNQVKVWRSPKTTTYPLSLKNI